VTIGVLGMVVLGSTTPFPRLLRGFELLRVPRLIVVIVAFMWRYLHVLGAEAGRMQTARAARGYSASSLPRAASSTGALISTLFMRSMERGERVYLAMLARGYSGSMPATAVERLSLRPADVLFLAALMLALALVRVLLP
ncbi:MAG: energy-coupling factor transporter transmembrane component T, partial [Actinomycetota bacterium]